MPAHSVSALIKGGRNALRDATVGKEMRRRLQVDQITLVASDCTGGCLYHDLRLRFDSPFINMFLPASDYVRVVSDLTGYLAEPLVGAPEIDGFPYPVARLGDAIVHLVHYKTLAEARRKWDERVERFDYKCPLFIMNDRNGFSHADGIAFKDAVGQHGVLFVHDDFRPEGLNVCFIESRPNEGHVPIMTAYTRDLSVHRNYDAFDFVAWINSSIKGANS